MEHEGPLVDWQCAHEKLCELAKTRARLDAAEGALLLDALRAGTHLHLGFGSFTEYIERIFGYKPRWTDERLRAAEALEGLPELAQSLRDGAINWSVARELSRVATADNEHAWLGAARGRTARQVEELVAGHRPGDNPGDPPDASNRRHVLRFEVSADTLASFREAMAKVRRDAGGPLDEDAALLLVARQILGGPTDAGRASYQIALLVCESCGHGWQQGRGEQLGVDSEVVEMAGCDAQRLGRVSFSTHVGEAPARARQDIPPAVRRAVMRRDGGRCAVPGCRNAVFLDLHHVKPRCERGDHDPDNLVVLCSAHHRAQHRGQLIIDGRASAGFVFRHADGSRYGAVVDPHAAGVQGEAFRALRSLGFRESEAKSALAHVQEHSPSTGNTTEGILRAALSVLGNCHAERLGARAKAPSGGSAPSTWGSATPG
jgi:hypothetical protein